MQRMTSWGKRISLILLIIVAFWLLTTWRNDTQHQLVYHFTWHETAVVRSQQDQSWTMTNHFGYRVTVERGFVSSASLTLVPCARETAVSPFTVQRVYAGHGLSEADPSRWAGPLIESLTDGTQIELPMVSTSHDNYCQLHYLVAQAEATAVPDMSNQTLFLTGTYTTAESATLTPFTITTRLAWGGMIDIPALPQGNPVEITIERQMASLLAEVDFEQMSADDQAMTVLRSLVENTAVTLNTQSRN